MITIIAQITSTVTTHAPKEYYSKFLKYSVMRPNYYSKYIKNSVKNSVIRAQKCISQCGPRPSALLMNPLSDSSAKNQQRNAPVVTRIRVDSVPTVCGPDEVTATLPARRRLPSLSPVSPAASTYRMKRRK